MIACARKWGQVRACVKNLSNRASYVDFQQLSTLESPRERKHGLFLPEVTMPHRPASIVLLCFLLLFPLFAATAADKFKVLHAFTPNQGDGGWPNGKLTLAPDGSFYGVTNLGGSLGIGTVYRLRPSPSGGWTETVVHSFGTSPGGSDGAFPGGSLFLDSAGNLYGTTTASPTAWGTVYRLSTKSKALSVLHTFCGWQCGDGATPLDAPILDVAGNVYGPACCGVGEGIVYKLKAKSWEESILNDFSQPPNDGTAPSGQLVSDSSGNLYGVTMWITSTYAGGGTVYELVRGSQTPWKRVVLHRFPASSSDGTWTKDAQLVRDRAGNLYGATLAGGGLKACNIDTNPVGCGTIFELSPGHNGQWVETILYRFKGGALGNYPNGIIFDNAGNIYGTTTSGGDQSGLCNYGGRYGGCGIVYKLTPHSGEWKLTVLHTFHYTDGTLPEDALTFDAKGKLYGTTVDGGPNRAQDQGVVFQITP